MRLLMVAQNEHCLDKGWFGTRTENRKYYDHRANEKNSKKSAGDVLGFAITWDSGGGCSIGNSIPPITVRTTRITVCSA